MTAKTVAAKTVAAKTGNALSRSGGDASVSPGSFAMSLHDDDRMFDGQPATLANWRCAPFSQWAFHNVPDLVATALIAAASDHPMALPFAPVLFDGFQLKEASGSVLDLAGFLRATATDGLVIVHNGRIVLEVYDHGNTQHTPHIVMSATKSVVGLIAGMLHGTGDLEIDAQVSDYVPEVLSTPYEGATVRHLLDMRTGVRLDESQQRAYAAASNWEPASPGGTPGDLHGFFETLGAGYATHGGDFSYMSANTDLLGWVIERATGQTFQAVASMLLWKPMGAAHAAFMTVDRKGAPRCTGGLCATLRDFARIGQLMLDKGRRGDTQIIPGAWLDDIAANGDRGAWKRGEFAPGFPGAEMSYRSGWYVRHDAPRTLFAMGIHGQNLFVDAANRLVIAKVSSQDSPIDHHAIALTHRGVAELRRCLGEVS